MDELPRFLADFEPAMGLTKADYTDFVVEEIPLYPADGEGPHTYFLLEKSGLSTTQAVNDIARALNVKRHEIGFAGLKDSRAVTRQWLSVEHTEPQKLADLQLPRLRILETTFHRNKIRLGHLKGNHFVIRIRQTEPARLAELQDALTKLTQHGVPNYFGIQRFGYRGDTWEVGRAIIRHDAFEAVDLILGRPTDADTGTIRQARIFYEAGKYQEATKLWPRMFHAERQALKALIRAQGKKKRALAAIDRSTRNFYVSAYQSHLFNKVVATRLETGLSKLWPGDLAWLHVNGAVFRVEDLPAEQTRADSFEISPTGPLFGYRMSAPEERPAELEDEIRAAEDLAPEAFRTGSLRVKGGRRPLRFQPLHSKMTLGTDDRGPYLELQFTLPRGCYATSLLRELFTTPSPATDPADNLDPEEMAEGDDC